MLTQVVLETLKQTKIKLIKILNLTAAAGSHAIIILTEWDEFVDLDYGKIFNSMEKPAYVFDGRRILNHEKLQKIGFHVKAIGKTLKE
jgi:UDPglucose 6-dehydrogenase